LNSPHKYHTEKQRSSVTG